MLKLFRKKAEPSPPVAVVGDLALRQPWARLSAQIPGLVAGGVTVTNSGGERDRLLSASSAAAGAVEIHGIRVVGAGMRMLPFTDGLAIPAETTIELRPRGYHLLFRDLRVSPAIGTKLPVSLVFEKAGRVDLDLVISDRGPVGGDALSEEHHPG